MSKENQTAKELLAGSIAGIAQVLVGQPFDTVKVRLQTQSIYSGPVDCFQKTLKNDGPLGFYKGTLTPLLGAGVCVAIQFGALEASKRYFGGGQLSVGQLYLSGAFAGICNSVVSGPMEHVRTRLQVQTGTGGYKGPVDFISKVYKQYGIAGLYKGQAVTVLREAHGYGVYFAIYEYFIQRSMKKNNIERNQVSVLTQMASGAASGAVLWMAIYPIDIVKSKLQTDSLDPSKRAYSSAWDCVQKTYSSQGIKGFYRGFSACMIRAGPANAATFVAYEVAMNLLGR